MKNIILVIFIMIISFHIKAENRPEWFQNRISNEVSRVYHQKSFQPHRDRWNNDKYRLIKLKDTWKNSDKEGYTYLNDSQRNKYLIKFKRGRIWDSRGNEFDTRGLREGGAQFVMTKSGKIYVAKKWVRNKFEHHSLVGGDPVVCAGRMVIHNGRLKRIDDISAQYPAKNYYPLTKVISKLKSKGISMRNVKVIYNKDFK